MAILSETQAPCETSQPSPSARLSATPRYATIGIKHPSPVTQTDSHDFSQPMDFGNDDSGAMNVDHTWDDKDGSSAASPPAFESSQRSRPAPFPSTAAPQESTAARAEMLAIERERWELEKQQARQKLELEKEQLRRADKIQEQESHIQLVKMFRGLIADGLTKNQAGRVVWRENWTAIRKEMDQDEE